LTYQLDYVTTPLSGKFPDVTRPYYSTAGYEFPTPLIQARPIGQVNK